MATATQTVRLPFVRGPGATVYGPVTRYLDSGGNGQPVLFVHGSGVGGSGKLAWTPIIDALGQRIRGIGRERTPGSGQFRVLATEPKYSEGEIFVASVTERALAIVNAHGAFAASTLDDTSHDT